MPENDRLIDTHKAYAVIVAGGSGTRMQSALPKQFLLLNGRPVLMHTLDAFIRSSYHPEIILVLPTDYHNYWRELCVVHRFTHPHTLVAGGATRFHSIKNAVDGITDLHSVVAVQDAVRPLTSTAVIDAAYRQAVTLGNAIVAVKSRDSVRRVSAGVSESLLRDEIYLVQTPQTFMLMQLKDAYQLPYHAGFTDDASVVEAAGHTIHLAEGNYNNLKITYPDDILIAELLIKKGSPPG